jgi:hypothetical protein
VEISWMSHCDILMMVKEINSFKKNRGTIISTMVTIILVVDEKC